MDGGIVSSEATDPDADIGEMSNALNEAYEGEESPETDEAQEKAKKIAQLEEQIAAVQEDLTKAEQAGDQEGVASYGQELQELKAQLAQLTGEGSGSNNSQDSAADSLGGSTPVDSSGASAPADSGGGGSAAAPSEGGGGGAAPASSGGGGGATPASGGGGGGGGNPGVGSSPAPFPLDTSYSSQEADPGVEAMLKRAGDMEGMHENRDTAAIQQITGKTGINPATTPWCAAFAMNLMKEHGVLDLDGLSNPNYCPEIKKWATQKNNYGRPGEYNPKPGDAIVFDWERNGETDHIGLVEKVVDGRVYTIEGNSGDAVKRKVYPLNSGSIDGYVKGKNDAAKPRNQAPAPTPAPAPAPARPSTVAV